MPFEEGVYRTEEGGQFINTTGGFMIVVPEELQFENVDKRLIHNKFSYYLFVLQNHGRKESNNKGCSREEDNKGSSREEGRSQEERKESRSGDQRRDCRLQGW
jgi:hypothetical protein